MARLDFRGAAAKVTASAAVGIGDTLITLVGDVSGWPTGATGRNFEAILDRSVAGKTEKVLCSAITGQVLTIVTRGYDGTTAIAHSAGCAVEHGFPAAVLDDYGAHVYDPTRNDHTQYRPTSSPIGTTDLAAGAVTTAKIAAANITTALIADANVTAAKIAAGVLPHAGVYSGTTDSSGVLVVTHGAGFTPSVVIVQHGTPTTTNLLYAIVPHGNVGATTFTIQFVPTVGTGATIAVTGMFVAYP